MNESLPSGTVLAGKYRIVRVLGRGGMGAVYLAENIAIGRQVAIKVLHAQIGLDAAMRQRFRQEARTTALIGHPGIVDVLDMGETAAGEAFIVMERLDGQTLGARLEQRGKLSVDEAVSILVEALDAINAAHAKGIVHRDLKPDNLFLVWNPRWCVKILDFGISRLVNEDVRLTASNTLMGSVLYMPPEQARDARQAGPPADLYALGATLYHALTGTPPFMGDNYAGVLSRVLADPPVRIQQLRDDIPDPLATLVMQLLEKNPAERPQSAAAVRRELLALVPAPIPPDPPKPSVDVFGDTRPPASALGETAAASALPIEGTRKPNVGSTSSLVGEVEPAQSAPRRGAAWIVGGAAVVALTVGTLLATREAATNTRSTEVLDARLPERDMAGSTSENLAAPPDAAVTDAWLPSDGALASRPDARTPRPRADAGIRSVARPDAQSPKRDGGYLGIQRLPGQ